MQICASFAREFAEAIIDAAEIAAETHHAVGVVGDGPVVYATRRFEVNDCLVVVRPDGNGVENVIFIQNPR